jgi:hypothetical protein
MVYKNANKANAITEEEEQVSTTEDTPAVMSISDYYHINAIHLN